MRGLIAAKQVTFFILANNFTTKANVQNLRKYTLSYTLPKPNFQMQKGSDIRIIYM